MDIILDRTHDTWQQFNATVSIDGLWAVVTNSRRATPDKVTRSEGYITVDTGGVILHQEDGDTSPVMIGYGAITKVTL